MKVNWFIALKRREYALMHHFSSAHAVYVNVKPGQGTIHVAIDTDVTEIVSRIWNLKITQIACDSPAKGMQKNCSRLSAANNYISNM